MENVVEPDNRFKIELKEPVSDTTGFKKIRVSNVEGDILDISFRRTISVPENGNRLKVPPDFGPFPIYPTDEYVDKLDQSISTRDGVFIPIYEHEAMWIHFDTAGSFAVKVTIDGINAISGESSTESISTDLRRIALLYEKKPIQDYIVVGNPSQKWLDGIKMKDDKIMQFVAAPTRAMTPSTKFSINATDGIRGIQFEIVPQKLDTIKRIPITVHTLSAKVIHINVSIESKVRDLINKIHRITSIPYKEQRLIFAGQELEDYRYLNTYGIVADSQLFLSFSPVGGPRSDAAQKYIPQTAAKKRSLESYTAIQERYGEKRDVIFANANTNIAQDIEADTFEAEDWDTEHTLIFNLQMINAPASEIILGRKPPPCPISAAVFKEYDRALLRIHSNDEEKTDNHLQENDRKVFKVTTDQSDAKGSFSPVEYMKDRLGSIYQLPNDDDT